MQSKLRFVVAVLIAGAAFCSSARADEFDARYQAIADARGKAPEAQRLHELFKVDWAYTMDVYPEYATYVGFPGGETRWSDLSPAGIALRKHLADRALPVLATIDRAQLGPQDRVSYDIFKRLTEEAVEGEQFPTDLIQVNQMGGVQQDASQTLDSMRSENGAQMENQLARLKALPVYIDQVIALPGNSMRLNPPDVLKPDFLPRLMTELEWHVVWTGIEG